MRAPCLYCADPLIFDPLRGWVHSDGVLYRGTCSCPAHRHRGPFAGDGSVICKTWRDDHAATPNRSVASHD